MGVDQLAVHFSMDGNMLHKDSDEAKRQLARMGLGESPSDQTLSEMEIPGEEELEVEAEAAEPEVSVSCLIILTVKMIGRFKKHAHCLYIFARSCYSGQSFSASAV